MTTTESKQLSKSSESWTSRWLPSCIKKQLILFATLPVCFLLAYTALTYLANPALVWSSLSLAATGFVTLAIWRRLGLYVSCTLLVTTFAVLMRHLDPISWHLMHGCSLLLTWLVTHLCFEEINGRIQLLQEAVDVEKKAGEEALARSRQKESALSEEKLALQQELERLKEEATLREEEGKRQKEHLQLVRSELDLLTQQKSEIVARSQALYQEADTRLSQIHEKEMELTRFEHEKEHMLARMEKAEQLEVRFAALQEGQQTLLQLQSEVRALESELEELKDENERLSALKEKAQQLEVLEAEKARADEMIELLKHNKDQVVILSAQLSEQTTRVKALQEENLRLATTKQESVPSEESVQLLREKEEKLAHLTSQLNDHVSKVQVLEERLSQASVMEETVNRLKLELEQQKAAVVQDPGLQKELSRTQGLYNQLRAQFAEKSRILDQTRQQLFKVEGNLECAKLDKENRELSLGDADDEIHILVEGLKELEEESIDHASEIRQLEAFIEHLLKE